MAGNGGGGSNVAMVVTGNKYIHVCLYRYPIYIYISERFLKYISKFLALDELLKSQLSDE